MVDRKHQTKDQARSIKKHFEKLAKYMEKEPVILLLQYPDLIPVYEEAIKDPLNEEKKRAYTKITKEVMIAEMDKIIHNLGEYFVGEEFFIMMHARETLNEACERFERKPNLERFKEFKDVATAIQQSRRNQKNLTLSDDQTTAISTEEPTLAEQREALMADLVDFTKDKDLLKFLKNNPDFVEAYKKADFNPNDLFSFLPLAAEMIKIYKQEDKELKSLKRDRSVARKSLKQEKNSETTFNEASLPLLKPDPVLMLKQFYTQQLKESLGTSRVKSSLLEENSTKADNLIEKK